MYEQGNATERERAQAADAKITNRAVAQCTTTHHLHTHTHAHTTYTYRHSCIKDALHAWYVVPVCNKQITWTWSDGTRCLCCTSAFVSVCVRLPQTEQVSLCYQQQQQLRLQLAKPHSTSSGWRRRERALFCISWATVATCHITTFWLHLHSHRLQL